MNRVVKNARSKPKFLKGKGRGGRPSLDEKERRSRRIGVPVNEEEEAIIMQKGGTYHMTKACFLRSLGLGHRMRRPIPAINFEAHLALGRMAANLNQLIVLIREGRAAGVDPKSLTRLYELLQSTRRALLTGEDDDRQDQ